MTQKPTLLLALLVAAAAALALPACDDGNDMPRRPDNGGRTTPPVPPRPPERPRATKLEPVDFNFLIPPPKSVNLANADLPILRAKDSGAAGLLLPKEKFFTVVSATGAEFNGTEALGMPRGDIYDSLVITGVRYDACAPQAYHGTANTRAEIGKCSQELRLVAQPWTGTTFSDAGLHLVYALTPEQGKKVRAGMRELKKACGKETSQVSVGPHPCLNGFSSGDAAATAFLKDKIRPLILANVGANQLKGVASMVTVRRAGKIEWHWRLFFKGADGLVQLPKLPHVGVAFMTFVADGSYVPEPTAELTDGDKLKIGTKRIPLIARDLGANPVMPAGADGDAFRQAITVAYMAENPRLSRLETAECTSCHVQSPALTIIETKHPTLIDAVAAEMVKRVKFPARLVHLPETRTLHANTLVPGRTNYVVINFGYLGDKASVNRRTSNEAEENARYIDEVFGAE